MRATISLGFTLALVVTACGSDQPAPRDGSSGAVDTIGAVAVDEAANGPAPATASERASTRRNMPRPATGAPRQDTPGARPPDSPAPSPPRAENDVTQLRGTLTVVGNAPVTQVRLQQAGGGNWTLAGPELPSLRRVAGLEVTVNGSPSPGGELMVRDFTVLSADGQPALDGILEHGGDTLYLRTASRRVRLGNPPADLHILAGARVWLTGSTDRGPNSFGLITPAR